MAEKRPRGPSTWTPEQGSQGSPGWERGDGPSDTRAPAPLSVPGQPLSFRLLDVPRHGLTGDSVSPPMALGTWQVLRRGRGAYGSLFFRGRFGHSWLPAQTQESRPVYPPSSSHGHASPRPGSALTPARFTPSKCSEPPVPHPAGRCHLGHAAVVSHHRADPAAPPGDFLGMTTDATARGHCSRELRWELRLPPGEAPRPRPALATRLRPGGGRHGRGEPGSRRPALCVRAGRKRPR